jgi:hypothetical protein
MVYSFTDHVCNREMLLLLDILKHLQYWNIWNDSTTLCLPSFGLGNPAVGVQSLIHFSFLPINNFRHRSSSACLTEHAYIGEWQFPTLSFSLKIILNFFHYKTMMELPPRSFQFVTLFEKKSLDFSRTINGTSRACRDFFPCTIDFQCYRHSMSKVKIKHLKTLSLHHCFGKFVHKFIGGYYVA